MTPHASSATRPVARALTDALPALDLAAARRDRIAGDRRFAPWLAQALGQRVQAIASTRPAAGWHFTLACGGGALRLAAPGPLAPALELACQMRDPALARAVLHALLEPLTAPLQALLGRLTLMNVQRQPALAEPRPELAGAVHLIDIDEEAAGHLDAALRRAPRASARAFSTLQLPTAFRLFSHGMTAEQLRSLRRGDVVVAPGAFRLGGTWRGLIVFGGEPHMQAEAHIDTEESTARLAHAPSHAVQPASPTALDALGDLVLPVSFEIDRARVTLDELAALGEGSVLELDVPVTQATVKLVCQGQTVGMGQLVAVGERLGVRIARMGLGAQAGNPGSTNP